LLTGYFYLFTNICVYLLFVSTTSKVFYGFAYPPRPPAPEHDRRDRHAARVLPLRVNDGTLARRHTEAAVGVRGRLGLRIRQRPVLALPRRQVLAVRDHPVVQALPVHLAVLCVRHIGEKGVVADGRESNRIGFGRGARTHAKEAPLRVDGP